ncbi:5-methylthioadenosine/S-adenosylhomocysteine deaminase [Butyrivibrio sp. INlla18]|uniref:amidohydrolase n=1 Tax=Butyrivibrio sp. INlla18 TaxID=1520806 RepID=UPI00088DA5BD|nr:amidohydrolase [Butyrivibrio sp. INlla18]SDA76480.1 5-methylthioadenosine/S-adenosylhomocysteine deaminase [Butyrivibrio sp. INlla18]
MRYRFFNARVLTMEPGRDIFNGEVWVVGDRIKFSGTEEEARTYCESHPDEILVWDEEIDCKGNLLMPGFKNAHTHSAMTLMRSSADDLPLSDWLNKQIFPIEAKMTAEDIYELSKISILEYLTSGITAAFEMYLTPFSVADAFRDCGFRCVQTSCVSNFSQSVELLERYYNELNGRDEFNSFILGVHAEYTCFKELLEKCAELVHKYKAPFWAHIQETESETKECMDRYGMTPIEFFDSIGLFDYGGGGYHLVWTSDKDREIMKKRGLYAVTNPGSNTKLASGIAPIKEYLECGIPVAIGTDGPASNNCLDMFREMFLVTGLGKLRNMDASCIDAAEVLKMATVNGARCMGLNDADYLSEGKLADMIMIDMSQPNMQPINNIVKNLVYSGSKSNILMTMIGGVIRYQNGKFNIGEEPLEIYEKAEKIKKRIYGL